MLRRIAAHWADDPFGSDDEQADDWRSWSQNVLVCSANGAGRTEFCFGLPLAETRNRGDSGLAFLRESNFFECLPQCPEVWNTIAS